jgi:hypothetical protein
MKAYLPSPSDSELQRTWDLLRAEEGEVNPVRFARTVLNRWGLVVEFGIPEPPAEPTPVEEPPP